MFDLPSANLARRLMAPFLVVAVALSLAAADAQTTILASFHARPCGIDVALDRSRFSRVVDGLSSDETLSIEGPDWNDTLITNCEIKGARGDGIEIRNVRNLTIANCEISDIGGTGIRLRSGGGTEGVRLIGNRISNVGHNGISAAKRAREAVDHLDLVIADNIIENSGMSASSGLTHGIYVQVSDVIVFQNAIIGQRDGNGVSIRSSGLVACNEISGRSGDNKPGIRYFADNVSGPSRQLTIRDNLVRGSSPAIELRQPDGWIRRRPQALVTSFVIEGNRGSSENLIAISRFWTADEDRFSIRVEKNFNLDE